MKKILIASTALVAAGVLSAGSASASEKIKLSLGGYSKWWVVGAWQDDGYEAAFGAGRGSANNVDVKGDNEIYFDGSTTLDNGLDVGIHVELEAGGNTDTAAGRTTTGDTIDKSWVYISGTFGKVILGSEANGTVLIHSVAPDAAGNTTGDGLLTGGIAIAAPANMSTKTTTEIDTDDNADKITYVSPTFYGFTVGGSYVPNVNEDNQYSYGYKGLSSNAANEIYGAGVMYNGTLGGVGVKADAGWVTYDIDVATANSNEYSFGTQLSYAGFTLGGSYRKVSQNFAGAANSNGTAVTNSANGYGWDIGLQYATGPYAISVAYFDSKADGSQSASGQDEIQAYQVSGKYTLGAGVDILATVGHIEYDDERAEASGGDANHNEGWVATTGLSLQF